MKIINEFLQALFAFVYVVMARGCQAYHAVMHYKNLQNMLLREPGKS